MRRGLVYPIDIPREVGDISRTVGDSERPSLVACDIQVRLVFRSSSASASWRISAVVDIPYTGIGNDYVGIYTGGWRIAYLRNGGGMIGRTAYTIGKRTFHPVGRNDTVPWIDSPCTSAESSISIGGTQSGVIREIIDGKNP